MNILSLIEWVLQLSQLSGLSSVQLCLMFIPVDVFPVYQVSPNTTEYYQTSLVMPPVSESSPTSPVHPGPDSLLPGATESFDSLVECQSLLEQDPDLSCLSPPLVPPAVDLLLFPLPVPMPPQRLPVGPLLEEPLESAVSSLLDLSREGPFDAYCVPTDTGSRLGCWDAHWQNGCEQSPDKTLWRRPGSYRGTLALWRHICRS